MERRSGTRWPFVIFLLFLCPALVSLAGESQVKLCQWCCVYCCCYLYFFPGCCFYYWCYYFFFPCCCCLYFPASLLSFNDTFVVVFVLFLAVYLPDVGNCHFFLFVICCPFLFLLFFLLFTFLRFINFALKPHYLSLKKIGQNFAFSLLKGTSAWRNTLCDLYQLWLFIVCARVWYLLYYWPISGEFQSLKNFTEHQIVDWNFSFFFFLSLIIMSPCSASPQYLQKKISITMNMGSEIWTGQLKTSLSLFLIL